MSNFKFLEVFCRLNEPVLLAKRHLYVMKNSSDRDSKFFWQYCDKKRFFEEQEPFDSLEEIILKENKPELDKLTFNQEVHFDEYELFITKAFYSHAKKPFPFEKQTKKENLRLTYQEQKEGLEQLFSDECSFFVRGLVFKLKEVPPNISLPKDSDSIFIGDRCLVASSYYSINEYRNYLNKKFKEILKRKHKIKSLDSCDSKKLPTKLACMDSEKRKEEWGFEKINESEYIVYLKIPEFLLRERGEDLYYYFDEAKIITKLNFNGEFIRITKPQVPNYKHPCIWPEYYFPCWGTLEAEEEMWKDLGIVFGQNYSINDEKTQNVIIQALEEGKDVLLFGMKYHIAMERGFKGVTLDPENYPNRYYTKEEKNRKYPNVMVIEPEND